MRKITAVFAAFCLMLTCCAVSAAESVSRMHYVFLDWVGEYTGQVDSGKIPFGFGLFESSTPRDGEKWHYIGVWENGVPGTEDVQYIGNKKSMKFHYPGCRAVSQMSEKNKVEFASREEAVDQGYRPCGECNP